MDESNPTYAAALDYAARGWYVIPVYAVNPDGTCQCGNAEEHAVGKHPIGNGWKERASVSGADLHEWFVVQGYTNLGIVTGKRSGIFVLDVDLDSGKIGDEHLGALEDEHSPLSPTLTHETGGGGWQFFFHYPEGREVSNSPGSLVGLHLDVRGDGGQVVAPPSVSGKGPYVVLHGDPVADAPEWLLDLIEKPKPRPEGEVVTRHADAPEGYVEAAVARTVAELASTPAGGRNEALNKAAFSLATMIPHGVITKAEVEDALAHVALGLGLEPAEIAKTLDSGILAGQQNPRPWPPEKREGPLFIPFGDAGGDRGDSEEWPRRSWDDFGNALRLLDHFPERLRWVEQAERWAVWRGDRWALDTTRSAQSFAMAMLDRLPTTEALSYDDTPEETAEGKSLPSERERFLKWVRSQRFFGKTRAVLDTAKGLHGIAAEITDFDREPLLVNLKNGVLDLESGALLSHAPELMMMEQAGASWVDLPWHPFGTHVDTPGPLEFRGEDDGGMPVEERLRTPCPRWEAFLERMQPDPEVRAHLRRAVGYALTGDISEQKMWLHLGDGANGKSVFLEVVTALLGSYAQAIPRTTLLAKKNEPIPTDVARMSGKRFLQTSETAKGQRLDEEMVKSLTGGETISARFMRQDFFDFTPTGKLHYITNHFPVMSEAPSLWRRLVIVPWPMTIADDDPTRDLTLGASIIRDELDGVLAWAIEGVREWQAVGLGVPAVLRDVAREYRSESDEFGEFLDDSIVTKLDAVTPVKTLYDAYTRWVFAGGRGQAMSVKAFGTAMRERGYEATRPYVDGRQVRAFAGVTVRQSLGVDS